MATLLTQRYQPVQCTGTPEMMGYQQGIALAEKIHGAFGVLHDIEEFALRCPWYLPFPLFRWIASRRAEKEMAQAVRKQSPSLYDRLLGLAKGARISPASLWLLQAMEAVLASMEGVRVPTPLGGCSAVAIRGSRSTTGEPVIAHNFDYLPIVQQFFFLRNSIPESGNRSLEFSVSPLAGCIDGVNDQGLAITYNYGQTRDHGEPGPTISLRISETMAKCSTVQEALNHLLGNSRWGSGLLMLADARGDMAALELTSNRAEVRRPGPGEEVLFQTNSFQCSNTREVEVPLDAVFDRFSPPSVRGIKVMESPITRYCRLQDLLADAPPLSSEDLANVMADHGPQNQPSLDTVCMHGGHWVTSSCFQWFPVSRKVRVSFSTACKADFVEMAL